MATNLHIVPLYKDEPVERMINRFNKKYRESDIYETYKKYTFYEKPSCKRSREKRRARRINDIHGEVRRGKRKTKNKQLYREIMEKF